MVVTPFEEAAFTPVNPDLPEGPQLSVLWGDPSTGPAGRKEPERIFLPPAVRSMKGS